MELPNPKHERFASEFIKDLNSTQAATRAGYSAKTAHVQGSRLLRNASIVKRIEELKAKRSKKLEINAEWVLKKLVENAEKAAQAEPVLDKEGNPIGEYTYQGSVVNKALELIGQHVNFFPDKATKLELSGKVDHEHSGTVSLSLTDELDRLAVSFASSADREEKGGLPADGASESVDS